LKSHEDLDVWQLAMTLVEDVYRGTRSFPREEAFGLTTQIRRAAVSIPSNIAEGAARNGNKEFLHFLSVAAGSASEISTQLQIAKRLGLAEPQPLDDLVEKTARISKMLQGLIRVTKQDLPKP
jgi:four helix bundle protein